MIFRPYNARVMTFKKYLLIGIMACAPMAAWGVAVHADDPGATEKNVTTGADDFEWKTSVGAMALYGPKYDGSDRFQVYYMPMLDAAYGPFFASTAQGVGAYLPLNSSRTIILSPAIRWRLKRNLGDDLGFADYIKNVRPTATVNAILKLDPFIFNVRATTGLISDNAGAMYNLGVAWRHDISVRMNLSLYTTLIYADREYNQTYFGVDYGTSAKYGFDVYDARSGFKSVDVGGVLTYRFTDHIAINVMAEYMRAIGAAAKSPVVLDKNQIIAGIGATYHF